MSSWPYHKIRPPTCGLYHTKTMESGKWVLHTLDCNVHFVIHIIIAVSLEDTGNTPFQSHWKIYDMSLPMFKISMGSAFPLDMTKRPC